MRMKLMIVSALLFVSLLAAQAADQKTPPAKDKAMPTCCGEKDEKVKTSTETKGSCKSACCQETQKVKQTALLTPKAADAKR
jgi:hypothetical protein